MPWKVVVLLGATYRHRQPQRQSATSCLLLYQWVSRECGLPALKVNAFVKAFPFPYIPDQIPPRHNGLRAGRCACHTPRGHGLPGLTINPQDPPWLALIPNKMPL
jgi:hypothetical protein